MRMREYATLLLMSAARFAQAVSERYLNMYGRPQVRTSLSVGSPCAHLFQ